MRFIFALSAMEVARRVTPAVIPGRWRLAAAILRNKALHAGPSLDQHAVDREVLAGEKLTNLRQIEKARKKLGRNIAVQQPVPVLAEHGRIPHRIVCREADEPAEQQIIVELLHQLPFRAHRVKRLKQQRSQQPLRRDRRASFARIEAVANPPPPPHGAARPGRGASTAATIRPLRPRMRSAWPTSMAFGMAVAEEPRIARAIAISSRPGLSAQAEMNAPAVERLMPA